MGTFLTGFGLVAILFEMYLKYKKEPNLVLVEKKQLMLINFHEEFLNI